MIYGRYRRASKQEKHAMLNEFCKVTRYHRKYALRVLNGPPPRVQPRKRRRHPTYAPAVTRALVFVWKAAGYTWSVHLKALLPLWLPRDRQHLGLSAEVERQLGRISPRQMDRRLKGHKRQMKTRLYGRTKPGTSLKHHIPLRTDRWDVRTPGFGEVDLVAHSGNCAVGEFVHSLNLTDIDTTWMETLSKWKHKNILLFLSTFFRKHLEDDARSPIIDFLKMTPVLFQIIQKSGLG